MSSEKQAGKTVLIAGGTGGIGSSVAHLCKQNRWNVCITGTKKGGRISTVLESHNLDLGFEWNGEDQQGIKEIVVNIINKFGKIDALVNAIGILRSKPFLEIDSQTALHEYEINTLSTLYTIQAVVPHMTNQINGGTIVNIASQRGYPSLASSRSISYSMSKAAIISLTSALAKLYSPKIKINAIAPGYTLTNMSNDWSEESWRDANQNNLYKRPAHSIEIARHILFMISDENSYMTGQTILVDGGYSLYNR